MEKMVYKAIIRYLKKHYLDELYNIVKRANEILLELKEKAPNLGGNTSSKNDNSREKCDNTL